MAEILIRAACFVAIIAAGALLRKTGFFKKEDFHLLSKIVIRITLPAAIITNFAGRELDYSLLFLILVGLAWKLLASRKPGVARPVDPTVVEGEYRVVRKPVLPASR